MQSQFNLGSDSRKAVNRRVPDISAYCSIFLGHFFFVPENKHFYLHGTCQVPLVLHCFKCLSKVDFISFYGDIRELLWGQVYSWHFIDFSTVIWSYVTPFLHWPQKDKWNSLQGIWVPYAIGKAIKIRHSGQKENNTFNKTLISYWCFANHDDRKFTSYWQGGLYQFFFLFLSGEHYDMYYFFSVKQNVKYIFIDGHRR